MNIKCTQCSKSISIPDEKVPKDQAFSLTCPSCKEKFKVDQHLTQETPAPSAGAAGDAPDKKSELDTASMVKQTEFEEEFEIYEEGDQIALVLDNRHKDAWVKTLNDRGYKIEEARSPEHAVFKMKFVQYHFVVLDEAYGNKTFRDNAAYEAIINMPMSSRRKIFVALVGSNFNTQSNMQAFQWSVNLVVNEKDLDKLPTLLKKSIADNETFYKVFKDTLQALGKA